MKNLQLDTGGVLVKRFLEILKFSFTKPSLTGFRTTIIGYRAQLNHHLVPTPY